MFPSKHYVPVLKGKRAEFPAIGSLSNKDHITPLLEAVPSSPATFVPTRMDAVWEADDPYFIDMLFFDEEDLEEEEADAHPLTACFRDVAARGQSAIPVTGTGRSPAYQTAIRNIVREQDRGFGIRLVPDDFEDEELLSESIESLVQLVGIALSQIDIFVDAGSVAGNSSSVVAQSLRSHLMLVPDLVNWRTVTAISGAFPQSLAPLERDTWNREPRTDWGGWRRAITRPQGIARAPSFGDYTIAHPGLPPGGRATILAQLRYTTPTEFLIWKGHNVFTHEQGYSQFNAICADLVTMNEYRGPDFSDGDREIDEKATNPGSSGNAETWRKIGTSHHIETVMDQIANLP